MYYDVKNIVTIKIEKKGKILPITSSDEYKTDKYQICTVRGSDEKGEKYKMPLFNEQCVLVEVGDTITVNPPKREKNTYYHSIRAIQRRKE